MGDDQGGWGYGSPAGRPEPSWGPNDLYGYSGGGPNGPGGGHDTTPGAPGTYPSGQAPPEQQYGQQQSQQHGQPYGQQQTQQYGQQYGPPTGPPPGASSEQRPSGPGYGATLIGGTPVLERGTTPTVWLFAALVLAVVAIAVVVVTGGAVLPSLAAWVLAGPVAIGLFAIYVRQDSHQRSLALYTEANGLGALCWATGIAAFAGIVLSAWYLASWAGRS